MSFTRLSNKINEKYPKSTNLFAMQLRLASDAQNLDPLLKSAADRIHLDHKIVSRMILSSDVHTKHQVQILKNLGSNLTTFDHGDGMLPEQLQLYVHELTNHITSHPLDDTTVPSYANILFHDQVNINNNDYYTQHIHIDSNNYNKQYKHKASIPILFAEINKENIKDDVCTICLLVLDSNNPKLNENQIKKVVQTKCNHQYHAECINLWVNIKSTCPLCRAQF